jgi:hypothetical protein
VKPDTLECPQRQANGAALHLQGNFGIGGLHRKIRIRFDHRQFQLLAKVAEQRKSRLRLQIRQGGLCNSRARQ